MCPQGNTACRTPLPLSNPTPRRRIRKPARLARRTPPFPSDLGPLPCLLSDTRGSISIQRSDRHTPWIRLVNSPRRCRCLGRSIAYKDLAPWCQGAKRSRPARCLETEVSYQARYLGSSTSCSMAIFRTLGLHRPWNHDLKLTVEPSSTLSQGLLVTWRTATPALLDP